jgi:ketosteroid isomerase-like protein
MTLLVLPAAVRGQDTQSKATKTSEQELVELTRDWDEALVKRDADTLNRILSDDYTFAHTPKAQYLAFLQLPELEYKSYERTGITARLYGDTAILFGKASVSGKYPGVDWFNSSFNFMDVWIKQKGQWKCIATMHDQIQGATSRGKVRVGPDVKAGLVIIFNAGTKDQQVNEFWRTVLEVADQSARGYRFRDGILSTLKVPPVEGHQALAVQFHDEATQAQKEKIKERIKGSTLVFRVFENIAPTDVKLK